MILPLARLTICCFLGSALCLKKFECLVLDATHIGPSHMQNVTVHENFNNPADWLSDLHKICSCTFNTLSVINGNISMSGPPNPDLHASNPLSEVGITG